LGFELIPISPGILKQRAVSEVLQCNRYSSQYGLSLTQVQALELVQTRDDMLKAFGRIEFGTGILDSIIKEFCDSPYLSMQNYEQTLHDLVEIFYYYKNDTIGLMSDDELLKYMKNSYDNTCRGSLEMLSGSELHQLARNLRFGLSIDYSENGKLESGYEDYE